MELPKGVRIRHFNNYPGMRRGASFGAINYGKVQCGPALSVDGPGGRLKGILDKQKVIADTCVDEWWNHLKLGIDTTVDVSDIRHQRPKLPP